MIKLAGFIVVHLVFYLMGSFIAWDFNPLNWWLFQSWGGRVIFLMVEIFGISNYLAEN